MIPMCKWVPEIFDKYILNWKLKNMYWLGKNSFGCGYNGYVPGKGPDGLLTLGEAVRRVEENEKK